MAKFTRREFLKLTGRFLTFIGLGAVVGPIIVFFYPSELEEMPSEPVSLGSVDDLPIWKAKTVKFGRYPAMVINTSEGLKAYSAVCTHFACITKWDEELGQIVCPCHEGFFDPFDGSVISGPPPAPLGSLKVEIVDSIIFVGGDE
jgi:Rieske Fe-S protein